MYDVCFLIACIMWPSSPVVTQNMGEYHNSRTIMIECKRPSADKLAARCHTLGMVEVFGLIDRDNALVIADWPKSRNIGRTAYILRQLSMVPGVKTITVDHPSQPEKIKH